ncbi:MAG: histidine phosphatase family protein [Chloroflexota bacterium]
MRIILVRHGDTKSNSRERFWGATDVELNEEGVRQAHCLRDRLASEKLSAVYCSDLQRACHTAEIIAAPHGLSAVTCTELREINFGELEGLAFSEISHRYPEFTRTWAQRNPDLRYPGGDRLEDFTRCVLTFLGRLEKHTDSDTVLVVAHSGVLRTLLCRLLGTELARRWQYRMELASLSIVETRDGEGVLLKLNDLCHLENK